MGDPTLGLYAIVKDVSKSRLDFGKTLEQLAPYLDYAVIGVSDQTTDDTKERLLATVAKAPLPIELHDLHWTDDFSDALNRILKESPTDWSLRLHQDRRINLQDLPNLRTTVNMAEREGYHVLRFTELTLDARKFRARPELLVRKGLEYTGVHCEHLIKTGPEPRTGRILDHCVTPDEILNTDLIVIHDDKDGRTGQDATGYRRQLTERELLRIKKMSNADDAATDYTAGMRLFMLGVSEHLNTIDDAARRFSAAKAMEPDEAAPRIMLGDCYRHKGLLDEARQEYLDAKNMGSRAAAGRLERLEAPKRERSILD